MLIINIINFLILSLNFRNESSYKTTNLRKNSRLNLKKDRLAYFSLIIAKLFSHLDTNEDTAEKSRT